MPSWMIRTRTVSWLFAAVALVACESPAADGPGTTTDVTVTADAGVISDVGGDAAVVADSSTSADGQGDAAPSDADSTVGLDTVSSDSPYKGVILINEINAGGSKTPTKPEEGDWAEIYNTGKTELDVGGWKFGGVAGGIAGALSLPAGLKVAGGGFQLVYFNHLGLGSPRVDKRLSSNGALAVWDTANLLVDSADWEEGAAPSGSTWARVPDGGASWKTVTPPTPGQPNAK